jgi:hypothetical protein
MGAVIGVLVSALAWLFKSRIGLWIATALVWLGINLTTVTLLVEPILDQIQGLAQGGFGGGSYGVWISAWVGVLGFDKCLTMIGSAYLTKKALTAGRLFLWKRGP